MTSDKRAGHLEAEPRPGLATSGMSCERWEHGKSWVGLDPGVPAGQVAAVTVGHGVQRDAAGPAGGGQATGVCRVGNRTAQRSSVSVASSGKGHAPNGKCPEAPPHPISLQKPPCSPPPPPRPVPGDDTLGPLLRTRLKCSNTRPTVRPPTPDPAQRPLSLPASRFHLGIPGH